MATNDDKTLMRPDQAEVFARGLYFLANIDGIDDQEIAIIRDFLEEVGRPELMDELATNEFDSLNAADVLSTSFLRRIFLKTALVLVRADGVLSDAEMDAIRGIAARFGLDDGLDELLTETEGLTIA